VKRGGRDLVIRSAEQTKQGLDVTHTRRKRGRSDGLAKLGF
jgi:hypothetical protein